MSIYDTTITLLYRIEKLKKQLKDEQEKNKQLSIILAPHFKKPILIRSENNSMLDFKECNLLPDKLDV